MPDNRPGLIALVPDEWHGIWMPRHQVVHRLRKWFEVLWLEPARGWRDYWLPHRNRQDIFQRATPPPDHFTLYAPGRWLPEVYRPKALGDWIRQRRVINAARILRKKGCKQVIVYMWRPQFSWALDAIEPDLSCYHIDDEYTFSEFDQPMPAIEEDVLRRVDGVIVHSRRLLARKGGINPNTILIPNGVDFASYSTQENEPRDLAKIVGPRIGYVGVIKTQLDLHLLAELAKRRPEWAFVFVGPIGFLGEKRPLFDILSGLSNVHFLGNKPIGELPAYTQHMDVLTMPYEVNDYTNCIYPLKLNEYLATGNPVVATPIETIREFGDVVCIASGVDAWDNTIADFLRASEDDIKLRERRRDHARHHDWDALSERVYDFFSERLSAKSAG